jgi:hypothetical protein
VSAQQARRGPSLTVPSNQPLIGVIEQQDGQEVTRYFTEEPEAVPADDAAQAALGVIGAWSDLDWDEMERELDRIRHESPPTPPIDL